MKTQIKKIDILYNTLKDTFSGIFWKFFLGSIGSLFLILFFGKNYFHLSIIKSIIFGIIFLVFLFILRFSIFSLKNIFKYLHSIYKESKYGDAIILLKEGFSRIHSLRNKDTEITDEEFMNTLIYFCNKLQKLFSNKSFCDCSVSIKVPVQGRVTAETSVRNLCRDTEHEERDTDKYKNTNHTIIGNTAFIKVLNNVLRKNKNGNYYINNNIKSTKDYENTSREVYKNGELPYNSELVVPLLPSYLDNDENGLLGFLCVDCEQSDRFDEKYDPALLEGVVDGIYDIIKNKLIITR